MVREVADGSDDDDGGDGSGISEHCRTDWENPKNLKSVLACSV